MATWGGLANSCEKKRSKIKREKERYTHLNAEFQRIARRDKKAFLSDQCKEIEENNRMGKPRDLFRKIRDSKGIFHAKMGTIKDRNSMDLSSTLAWKIPRTEEPGRLQSMGSWRVGHDWATFTFTFHFHALEKEMATHSSVLAWRIPGMGEHSGLPDMGSHRVGHDWSDLAAAAATEAEDIRRGGRNTQKNCTKKIFMTQISTLVWSLT